MRLWRWLTDDRVAFSDDGVERWFLGCKDCGRIRPYYELVAAKGDAVMLCQTCGGRHVRPVIVTSWLKGMWHVLIKGYLWRHKIRGKAHQQEWDPRMPYFRQEFTGFSS